MLKMYIDNEEVVSKNDFTIKEEMQSASSTILNNTYPKSWEQDKDYTSRFYYPKDYAKLNIQNFTRVQEAEAGTTVQINGSATLTDVDTTKNSRVLKLLGQTSQTTTSGKNKLYVPNGTYSNHDVTAVVNNGVITLNGTANGTSYININLGSNVSVSGEYYTYSISNTATSSIEARLFDTNNNYIVAYTTTTNYKVTKNDIRTYNMLSIVTQSGVALNNFIIKPQLENGSSATTFEPYTYGATPNPNYPQPVNVVSGDNTINISGKNLVEGHINGYAIGSNGRFASNSDFDMHIAKVIQGETYTATTNEDLFVAGFFTEYPTTNSTSYNASRITQTSKTFTAPITGYITFRSSSSYQFAQCEVGTQATNFEPYVGSSYPIYLGVENLDTNGTAYNKTANSSGVVQDANEPSKYLSMNDYVRVEPNTTYSVVFEKEAGGNLFISTKNADGTFIARTNLSSVRTFTTDSNTYYVFLYIYKSSGAYENVGGYVRLTKGSTPQHISTTPIELCKIGNYQDSIYKGVGSNLLDSLIQGTINTSTGEFEANPNTEFRVSENYIKVDSNKVGVSYSTGGTQQIVVFEYKNDYTYITYQAVSSNSNLFTLNSETQYIKIRLRGAGVGTTDITNAIVSNNGVLPYEPYNSKDKWLLHKEIGKVVLNGSENWYFEAQTYRLADFNGKAYPSFVEANKYAYSNNFQWKNGISNNFVEGAFWYTLNGTILTLQKDQNPNATTLATFKTWLSTHNTIVYYVLETPTTTEITDTLLLSQLDNLESS